MLLSEIWAECGRLLNDPTNQRWTTDVLTKRANMAQDEIQGLTNAKKSQEVLTYSIGVETVDVAATTLNILRVLITRENGDIEPLFGLSLYELDFLYPGWRQEDDGPPKYWWFDQSNQRLHLVPNPDITVADGLTVWEINRSTEMSVGSDVPFNGNLLAYHMSIVHWVVAQCWMDDATPESMAKARFHKSGVIERPGEFEKQIIRIRKEFDAPDGVPARILWMPQGGRVAGSRSSKSNPLGI